MRIYKDENSPPDYYENSWHADTTWREVPQMGAVLRCVSCPPVGGDTMWANMEQAYEDLPDHIKETIAPLKAPANRVVGRIRETSTAYASSNPAASTAIHPPAVSYPSRFQVTE